MQPHLPEAHLTMIAIIVAYTITVFFVACSILALLDLSRLMRLTPEGRKYVFGLFGVSVVLGALGSLTGFFPTLGALASGAAVNEVKINSAREIEQERVSAGQATTAVVPVERAVVYVQVGRSEDMAVFNKMKSALNGKPYSLPAAENVRAAIKANQIRYCDVGKNAQEAGQLQKDLAATGFPGYAVIKLTGTGCSSDKVKDVVEVWVATPAS